MIYAAVLPPHWELVETPTEMEWTSTNHRNNEPSYGNDQGDQCPQPLPIWCPHQQTSTGKEIWRTRFESIFLLPRLPKENMLQLSNELSKINLPCKINDKLVDEFYEDINHGSQHQDNESSTEPIRSNTGRRDSKKSSQQNRFNQRQKFI